MGERASASPTRCEHLDAAAEVVPLSDVCQECQAAGQAWVHLRVCLTCGHVGCCDESRNKHATQHYLESQHPVMQSLEPGEGWRWCYLDRLSFSPDARVSKEFMRRLVLFEALSEEDLDRLRQSAELVFLPAGQAFIQEGGPGEAMYFILEGEVEVTKRRDGREVVLAKRSAGEYVGEMALLEDRERYASVRTIRDSRLLMVSRAAFQDLLTCNPSTPLVLLKTVTERLRSTESLLLQRANLASLGTLAAGLAHELNNPSAAIARSAEQLRDALQQWERATIELGALRIDPSRVPSLADDSGTRAEAAVAYASLDPLARADREEEIESWLEARGVQDAWELAPALAAAGVTMPQLQAYADDLTPLQLAAAARTLAARATALTLVDELARGAHSISEIVGAVKSYAYLDQAPVQTVDVRDGLENTLVILRHKTRGGISVVRRYQHDSQVIEGYASELSQVWTNIIDNAIQAMQGQGELTIRTAVEGERIVVEICDTGPGIPADAQARLFEAFFTTKPQGEGTGLGLHIAYNIVVQKHQGQIEVDSRPGSTCFRVRLPIELARAH